MTIKLPAPRLMKICIVAFLLSGVLCEAAAAQDMPTAYRVITYQAGAGFSFARPDFGETYIKGFSAYADADIHQRVGLELNVNIDNILTPSDIGETSYLLGPRFIFVHQEFAGRRDFFSLYGKVLGGVGTFYYEPTTYFGSHQSYGALGFGGGIDIHASPRFNIRAIDIDWQRWPGYRNGGLAPLVVTLGGAYRF